jgi:biopolymer transport protein ExbD
VKIKDDEFFEEAALNLAPMIDVVFLLLIFFMVATTFVQREKEMGLDLPQAESGEDAREDLDELVINLLQDGTMRLNGADYDEDGLRNALGRAAKANPETPVTIRGDKDVVLQRVVFVMDACRLAGLTDIGMMTLDG